MRNWTAAAFGVGLLVAGFGLTTPASAISLLGYGESIMCCAGASGLTIGGWDYQYGGTNWHVRTDGVEQVGYANFAPSEIWAAESLHTNDAVSLDLGRELASGISYAHGDITIGAGGAIAPSTVHAFDAVVGGGLNGLVGATSSLGGTFVFDGVSVATPLYWGIEWSITISNDAGHSDYVSARIGIDGLANVLLPDYTPIGTSRVIEGSLFGSTTSNLFTVRGDQSIFNYSPFPPAEMAFAFRVAFSDMPFDDIPEVPEPGTLALIGVPLALLASRRPAVRRR